MRLKDFSLGQDLTLRPGDDRPARSHEAFFKTFAAGKADVLIGTPNVTKGLDSPP